MRLTLEEAMDRWPECTDAGEDDHFFALIEFGECPWCGLSDEDGYVAAREADTEKRWGAV